MRKTLALRVPVVEVMEAERKIRSRPDAAANSLGIEPVLHRGARERFAKLSQK